jgi:hypothetical protein
MRARRGSGPTGAPGGRLGRVLGLVAAAFLLAVGLLAPAGSAAAESFSFGPGSVTFARLHATHGYRVNFSETEGGYFFVRMKGHGSITDFATKTGRAPGSHLVADFGTRGRFDLRFVPVGKPEPIQIEAGCEGAPGSWQPGYLIGRARFRTERGFARIDVHRVAAFEESWSRLTCEFKGELPTFGHPKEKRTSFSAVSSDAHELFVAPKRSLSFRATQFFPHAKPAARRVLYVAELRDRTGRVSVVRKVSVAAPEDSFGFPGLPHLPEELALKPPAPFSGGAEFLRTPESTFTWRGDLAVRFPGLAPIRLAGKRFATSMCTLEGCARSEAESPKPGS